MNQTQIHLKTLSVNGGISKSVANFPTIKFPDQNKAARTSKPYARKFFDKLIPI